MPEGDVQTYWLEASDQIAVGLRRYVSKPWEKGPDGEHLLGCEHGHHDALIYIGRDKATFSEDGYREGWKGAPPEDDPRWPATCSKCDYRFLDSDERQNWSELIYRVTFSPRADVQVGQEYVIHQNPDVSADAVGAPMALPGATWDAWWYRREGPDGITLMVLLPNRREWNVDSEASNCTRKGDLSHYCWVRDGDPRQCNVTAGKDGDTCSAGAGSIQAGDYHGFLRNGVLSAG